VANWRLVERAPQARCYRCGSRQLASICHHLGCLRLMCGEHIPAPRRSRSTAEFAGLRLEGTPCGATPVHCPKDEHVVRGQLTWVWITAAVVGLVGVFLVVTARPPWPGLLALAVCLLLAVVSARLNRRREEAARKARPTLPLLPRLHQVEVTETLPARITIDEQGAYRVEMGTPSGSLTVAATFGRRDREAVSRYRDKYLLGKDKPVGFSLGFAVLRGPAELARELGDREPAVLRLEGHVHNFPLLAADSQLVSALWRKEHTYKVGQRAGGPRISLVPSLVQGTSRRVLDLDLQWPETEAARADGGLVVDRVERVCLDVPTTWGGVQQVTGDNVDLIEPKAEDGQAPVHRIIWHREPVTADERRARRKTFQVWFNEPIDTSSVIRGQLELRFTGALSGLEGVDLYYPLGRRRDDQPAAAIATSLVADFELSLVRVRHQDVRFVPDVTRTEDDDKPKTLEFDKVVPDHGAVISLTRAISQQGYYVKRVVENPPRTGAHANRVNRSWDITGRIYDRVYPIHFHLVVDGEEIYDGDIRARAGTTRTTLTVQGAFANQEMEQRVEGVWEQLSDIVTEELRERARAQAKEG
jgi:hypothetical protein